MSPGNLYRYFPSKDAMVGGPCASATGPSSAHDFGCGGRQRRLHDRLPPSSAASISRKPATRRSSAWRSGPRRRATPPSRPSTPSSTATCASGCRRSSRWPRSTAPFAAASRFGGGRARRLHRVQRPVRAPRLRPGLRPRARDRQRARRLRRAARRRDRRSRRPSIRYREKKLDPRHDAVPHRRRPPRAPRRRLDRLRRARPRPSRAGGRRGAAAAAEKPRFKVAVLPVDGRATCTPHHRLSGRTEADRRATAIARAAGIIVDLQGPARRRRQDRRRHRRAVRRGARSHGRPGQGAARAAPRTSSTARSQAHREGQHAGHQPARSSRPS